MSNIPGLGNAAIPTGFDNSAYLAANLDIAVNPMYAQNPALHYQHFGAAENRPLTNAAPALSTQVPSVTPQTATTQNSQQLAQGLVGNPQAIVNAASGTSLGAQVPTIDPNTSGTNVGPITSANGPNAVATPYTAAQAPTAQAALAQGTAVTGQITKTNDGKANTYEAATTFDKTTAAENQMRGAKGTVDPKAIIDPNKIQADINAISTGKNPDGSVNEVGKALNAAAQQNIVNVIDTDSVAGKLLASQLGEGNYTDKKATVKGQLDVLSSEFADANGNPKIPPWAQGTARNVAKIAGFSGMTGTAATAAMATAIMEASLPIAQADATFFQTLTVQNLSNRQEQTINKANVLSKLELANMDVRMTAAVENSRNFMQMDLANLSNEQQARAINTQARFQSILEDGKAINTQRMFTAQSQNDMNMFYDNLSTSMSQFNAAQINGMTQFNVGEANQNAQFNAGQSNSMSQFNVGEQNQAGQFNAGQSTAVSQFNAQLENTRQEFYKNMQYQIDTANAKWRQTVTLTTADQKFQAAAADVANTLGISKEALNQLWDRSDALLDYVWKSSESELERKNNLLLTQVNNAHQTGIQNMQNSAANTGALWSGIGSVAGTILGASAGGGTAGTSVAGKLMDWLF